MNKTGFLLPSSIGLLLLAIVFYFSSWNSANLSIPISAILFILSVIVFAMRLAFKEFDERLTKLEKQNKIV
ncbi:MAG TPA: hypothetical protein VKI62_05490 [Bacteroidota bacterium]|nr:hypothetical protein [Bacteroidota bacterium]